MKKYTLAIFVLLVIIAGNLNAQNITISMVGGGLYGGYYNGDGMPGYKTTINTPYDVCLDAAHNMYFTDQGNAKIRMVSAKTGIVSTVAGGGTSTVDGIPATSASINPYYMCIDAAGNIYFSSAGVIRKVRASTGIITTIAGTGALGYSGDAGLATTAKIWGESGICIDAVGNVYIADCGNNRIRKVNAVTGIITTIAGTGTAGYSGDGGPALAAELSGPIAICVNASGNVFFSDQGGTYIREVNAATGNISLIAGNGSMASGDGGAATSAGVGNIYGICVDGFGDIYINDISCACRKINMSTGIITTVAGSDAIDGYNGEGTNSLLTWFNFPHGVYVDGTGNIYIADQENNRIRKAIQLTSGPLLAYGKGQYIYPCSGVPLTVNNLLAIGNMNIGQVETWTVISAPANGTLIGFPYTMLSKGTDSLAIPSGLSYKSSTGYLGADSFRVRVSNGMLSDTMTIYVSVNTTSAIAITSPSSVCTGEGISLTAMVFGGTWTVTNSNAYISSGELIGYSNGLDTIIYSVPDECAATSVVTVNVSPNAGTIYGISDVCIGALTTLTDPISGGHGVQIPPLYLSMPQQELLQVYLPVRRISFIL